MAQAQTKATRMSKEAAKPATGASTIAALESRTTSAAATAPRSEGLATGNNFTGQYLWDRFITDGDKEDVTKMDIVRQMVKALDVASFKTLLAEFVGIAKSYNDKAINEAKQAGLFDEKNPTYEMQQTGAKLKTARNHQTVMRTGYGALRFAPDQLAALGGNDQTGYSLMRVIGAKALTNAGVNWDGTKAETPESKQARKAQSVETSVMLEVQAEMPKQEGEDRLSYLDRIMTETDKRMKARNEEQHALQVKTLAAKIKELSGPLLEEVIDALLAQPETDKPSPDVALH